VTETGRIFLTAEWRHLAMLNYAIDPELLRPLAPPGTELDSWNGQTLVTLVGFLFLRTESSVCRCPSIETSKKST
jgi:uncharacterized protein